MAEDNAKNLDSLLREALAKNSKWAVTVKEQKKGIPLFRKQDTLISVVVNDVVEDILVGCAVEKSLRKAYGYGQIEKSYFPESGTLQISYRPLQDYSAEKVVKSTGFVAGSSGVSAPEEIPRYRTAGSN